MSLTVRAEQVTQTAWQVTNGFSQLAMEAQSQSAITFISVKKKKKIISTIKFTGHEIVIALLVPEWLSCIFGFIGFFFPLMAEDGFPLMAFLHKEFVALTACPVGCLKSSEKRGDKEDRSGNHCASGAGASRLKAKDFRKLRLFFGC